jgi:hypothetical protein
MLHGSASFFAVSPRAVLMYGIFSLPVLRRYCLRLAGFAIRIGIEAGERTDHVRDNGPTIDSTFGQLSFLNVDFLFQ